MVLSMKKLYASQEKNKNENSELKFLHIQSPIFLLNNAGISCVRDPKYTPVLLEHCFAYLQQIAGSRGVASNCVRVNLCCIRSIDSSLVDNWTGLGEWSMPTRPYRTSRPCQASPTITEGIGESPII